MTEYPEPKGYNNIPGFVKSNPLNNSSYIEKCCEDYPKWADILRDTNEKLEEIVPGYNISQIKDKFGGLRYYWKPPEEWTDGDKFGEILPEFSGAYEKARGVVRDAEGRADDAL